MSELLKSYSRQPKIYLRLPSGGQFYANNPTEKTGTGELPVLSMTAKDELILRTPDALMNGESVHACIKNCIPLIDDPWEIPLIDLDAILIAIRIATYGEKMKMTVPVPRVENEDLEIEVDLVSMLDSFNGKVWEPIVKYGELTLHTAPLKFQDQNIYEQQNYETQKFISLMRDNDRPLAERKGQMTQLFESISDMNVDIIAKQIKAIETPDGEFEYNAVAIKEFLNSLAVKEFDIIRDQMQQRRELFDLPPQKVVVPQNLIEEGAPKDFEVPMVFNQASFFALK